MPEPSTRSGATARLLVLTTLGADDPVADATLGEHLRLLGRSPMDVAVVARPGSEACAWGTPERLVSRTRPLFVLRFAVAAWWAASRLRPEVVYARDVVAGLPMALLPRCFRPRLVFDLRGLVVEEGEQRTGSKKVRRFVLGLMERLVLRRAAGVLTVSEALSRVAYDRGTAPGRVAVVPNGSRFSDLADSASGPTDIGYFGSDHPWQLTDEALDLITAVSELDPEVAGVVATRDERLRSKAASRGLEVHFGLRRDEVRALLGGVVASVVLRADTLVTRVASPVKIGEALAAGSAVVLTEFSCEQAAYLASRDAAFLWDADVDPARLVAWLQERRSGGVAERRRIREVARTVLDLDRFRPQLEWFYGGAHGQAPAPNHGVGGPWDEDGESS